MGGLLASVVGGSSWERRDMSRCVKEDELSLRLMSGYDRHISDKLSTLISVGTQGKTEMTPDNIHGAFNGTGVTKEDKSARGSVMAHFME